MSFIYIYLKDIGRISRILNHTSRETKLPCNTTSLKWPFPSWLVLTTVAEEHPCSCPNGARLSQGHHMNIYI